MGKSWTRWQTSWQPPWQNSVHAHKERVKSRKPFFWHARKESDEETQLCALSLENSSQRGPRIILLVISTQPEEEVTGAHPTLLSNVCDINSSALTSCHETTSDVKWHHINTNLTEQPDLVPKRFFLNLVFIFFWTFITWWGSHLHVWEYSPFEYELHNTCLTMFEIRRLARCSWSTSSCRVIIILLSSVKKRCLSLRCFSCVYISSLMYIARATSKMEIQHSGGPHI